MSSGSKRSPTAVGYRCCERNVRSCYALVRVFLLLLAVTTSKRHSLRLVTSFSVVNLEPRLLSVVSYQQSMALFASKQSATNNGATTARRLSNTARDSAVLVEWEQTSELQRRIEDGIHYEHWHDQEPVQVEAGTDGGVDDDAECAKVKGVFFGYRVTPEEHSRLKSAHPDGDPVDL